MPIEARSLCFLATIAPTVMEKLTRTMLKIPDNAKESIASKTNNGVKAPIPSNKAEKVSPIFSNATREKN